MESKTFVRSIKSMSLARLMKITERKKTVIVQRHHHLCRKSYRIYGGKKATRIKEFSKVIGYKINLQKAVTFL